MKKLLAVLGIIGCLFVASQANAFIAGKDTQPITEVGATLGDTVTFDTVAVTPYAEATVVMTGRVKMIWIGKTDWNVVYRVSLESGGTNDEGGKYQCAPASNGFKFDNLFLVNPTLRLKGDTTSDTDTARIYYIK